MDVLIFALIFVLIFGWYTLGFDNEIWLNLANDFGKDYHGAVGSLEELAQFAKHTGKQWISGKNRLRQIYH